MEMSEIITVVFNLIYYKEKYQECDCNKKKAD